MFATVTDTLHQSKIKHTRNTKNFRALQQKNSIAKFCGTNPVRSGVGERIRLWARVRVGIKMNRVKVLSKVVEARCFTHGRGNSLYSIGGEVIPVLLVEIACQHVLWCFGGPSPQTQRVGAANLIRGQAI